MPNKGGRRDGKYSHVLDEKVFEMYYANSGTFDWKTGQGEPGDWKYTLWQIREKFGMTSDSNVLDRVRRRSKLGKRTLIAPGTGRQKKSQKESIETLQEVIPEDAPPTYYMARLAQNGQLLRATMTSPRGLRATHEVAKDLARAMGVPCPGLPEWATQIAKLTK